MKTMIFIFLFSFSTLMGYSQNFVGSTYRQIKASLEDDMGLKRNIGKIETGTWCVFYILSDEKAVITYFFDKNELTENSICSTYMKAQSYDYINEAFKELDENFVKGENNTWIQYGREEYLWELEKWDKQFTLIVTKKEQ